MSAFLRTTTITTILLPCDATCSLVWTATVNILFHFIGIFFFNMREDGTSRTGVCEWKCLWSADEQYRDLFYPQRPSAYLPLCLLIVSISLHLWVFDSIDFKSQQITALFLLQFTGSSECRDSIFSHLGHKSKQFFNKYVYWILGMLCMFIKYLKSF